MMRSMFSGVTGLKAHQTKMDVVGNNVANVNTVGFKSGRVLFQEVFNQTLQNSGSPDPATGRGGTNPMQVGLGLGIASVDTVMSRGTVQRTDNPLDLSVEGEGFFVVKGGANGLFKFTRAGNFNIDKLGNVVTASGQTVYGWNEYKKDSNSNFIFNTEKSIEPLNIYQDATNGNKKIISAKAITSATFNGNLDASYPVVDMTTNPAPQFLVPFNVFDSLGNEYNLNIEFYKTLIQPVTKTVNDAQGNPVTTTESQTTWDWRVSANGQTIVPSGGSITFNDKGEIADKTSPTVIPELTITPDQNTVGSAVMNTKIDFSQITMFRADSSAKPAFIDGYKPGTLVSFNVGGDGVITGIYSNGQQQPVGLMALAIFENPGGLKKEGENLFVQSTNSGEFKNPVRPGKDGAGTLNPGTLEMSNVDLSKEFTEMIVTQRGFQANSRIITASDEMLTELINLKR